MTPIVVLGKSPDDAPPGIEEFDDRVEWRVTDSAGLATALPGASGLLLWDFFSPALAGAWHAATDLRWIHAASAGVDTLLFPALRESDVVLTNARGVFDRPIAEFVLASVLAHVKELHHGRDQQRAHIWQHRETGMLAGRRALVVGTGAIGREIARLLAAVGVEIRGAGRTARTGDPDFGDVVESTRLAEHVDDVDYVIMVAPLTSATEGLIDADVLKAMPSHAHLVNVGRGATVDEPALIDAVSNGEIDGATLDVFVDEPLPLTSPLWDLSGIVMSPHLSGDVRGWRGRLADQYLANLRRWFADEPLVNVVDKERGYVPG